MTAADRASVVSSFTIIKGAMIDETLLAFANWDLNRTKRENLDELRRNNSIGAASSTWLRDVAKVLNRRYDPAGRDRALVLLAKQGCPRDIWVPIQVWHMTRDEFLVRDFLLNWLYPAFVERLPRIEATQLGSYFAEAAVRGGLTEHAWTETTRKRVAAGLLRMATDFGLLRGGLVREFASYQLPDDAFLYVLHAIHEDVRSARAVIESPEWRMFLMSAADVERTLLRLHQFRRVVFDAAGSLLQLTLPFPTAIAYAEAMPA